MLAFISSHLKHVVTVGFVIGLMSLAVRYLDEKLSTEQKAQFERWIQNIESKLKRLTLVSVHAAIRPYRWIYLGLLVTVWTLFLVKTHYQYLVYYIIGLAAILLGWCFLYLFPVPPGESIGEQLRWGVGAFGKAFVESAMIAVASVSVVALVDFIRHGPRLSGIPPLLKVLGTLFGILALWPALVYLPFAVIALLRIQVAVIAKPVLWICAYPKGPWAGLVFALTMALGIFRLFL